MGQASSRQSNRNAEPRLSFSILLGSLVLGTWIKRVAYAIAEEGETDDE
jgi:hypothetical protein